MHADAPRRPMTPAALRHFALAVGSAFVLMAALAYWRGRMVTPIVLATIGLALVAGGLAAPGRLGPLYDGWMALAAAISRVTTPLFMGVVYFALLTPIGLVRRLFGWRAFGDRRRGGGSRWVNRPAGARRSDLHRQF